MSFDKQWQEKLRCEACVLSHICHFPPAHKKLHIFFIFKLHFVGLTSLHTPLKTILFPALMKWFEGLHELWIREDTLWERDNYNWKRIWLSGASCHRLNCTRDNKLVLWATSGDVCGISFLRRSYRHADSCAAFLCWLSRVPAFGAVILQHERQTWDALARSFQAVG